MPQPDPARVAANKLGGEPVNESASSAARGSDTPTGVAPKDSAAISEELTQQADKRVFTNDLAALEHLILHGDLPPDEMQAAAWLLVQRVRGLRDDLNRLQQALVRSRGMREYVEESRTHGR